MTPNVDDSLQKKREREKRNRRKALANYWMNV